MNFRNLVAHLEKNIFGNQNECEFDLNKEKQVILLPGLISPVSRLFPLVRFIRKKTSYGVTAIPLGLSLMEFDKLLQHSSQTVTEKLIKEDNIKDIVLIGHSHGGRVASALLKILSNKFPDITYSLIILGTPIVKKPNHQLVKSKLYSLLSKSYCDWPQVEQPSFERPNSYIAMYSIADRTVPPEFAKTNNTAQRMIELKKVSHQNLVLPMTIGSELLKIIDSI